jgi:RHS repeat-associated protein
VTVTPSNGSASTAVSQVTYQPFGPISGYTLGNGQAIARTYDANYRLTDLVSPAFTLHVARDAMGDITAIGNSPGANPATETYSYDPLYRLTTVTEANGTPLEGVTYNPTGDRLTKTGSGLDTGTYGYNPNTHQLVSVGNSALTVDANGNTTAMTQAGSAYGFGYSARNRMTVAQLAGSTVGSYTYNALNQRVQKVANGTTERYDYGGGGQVLGEYGATNRDYIWMGGIPVANVDTSGTGSTIAYVTADQLGTPRAVSDANSNTLWQWAYQGNPWGEQAPTSNGYVYNLAFPGQYYDGETGLFYNVNRDYNSGTGRYIESDPKGLSAGPNTYAYAGSNTLAAFDQLGLSCTSAMGTVVCSIPGGPTFAFPAPAGWPATMDDASSADYHFYDVPVGLGGANAGAVEQQIVDHPTPGGYPFPATPGGTPNNATPQPLQDLSNFLDGIGDGQDPGGFNNSPVISYLAADISTGNPIVVNVTQPGHGLFPGYVAREICGGIVHNYGEGTAWLQSRNSPFRGPIDNVWINQTQNLINNTR